MILGSITITERAVSTHRDSYLLENLSVVSVRRPFLPGAVIIGGGLAGFALGFADLLYTQELVLITGLLVIAIFFGWQVGQLKLLSRDLRGSELSGVIWGGHAHLNRIRAQIMRRLSDDSDRVGAPQ